jgi:hypothetical protein
MLKKFLARLRSWRASRKRTRYRFEAIIYFDGPRTKFRRSKRHWSFKEERARGLRIPIEDSSIGFMPYPDEEETICTREFKSFSVACGWVRGRLNGFDHEKIVGEVRPL